jgi:hypothetical protein
MPPAWLASSAVGSGLILLIIVGAWLAVLVPMALRSHDTSTSLSSVDRFSDAMRVLSRREQNGRVAGRAFVMPARPVAARETLPLAVRRRRVLLTVVALALVTLLLGLVGPGWLLAPAALFAGLAVAYVVHLRRQAVLKAERDRRAAARARRAAPPAVRRTARPIRIAGVPDRMPPRPAPLGAPLPAPAARYEDPLPIAATGTDNASGTWSPVPVPVPTYVTKPVAPPRPPRVLDLTRPGEWSAAMEAEDPGMGLLADDGELDDILDRRRAVGGW